MPSSLGFGAVLPGNFVGNNFLIGRGSFYGHRSTIRGRISDLPIGTRIGSVRNREEAQRTVFDSRISASGINGLFPRRFNKAAEIRQGSSRGERIICSASLMDYETLQWVSSIASLVLMLARGTAIQKSFLAPLFALQAPASIISWIKGEYGIFTAFIALLVRLFFHIPGELELPFLTVLLVIVTPYQAANLRRTQVGSVISLLIAGYLAYQHFSRAGGYQKAFDQGSVIATVAIICIVVVPCFFLF
ncbi:cold-regulated 413 inner membrane protein 1, chloroplastic-like isoform X1 [Wolffia australiana]